MLPLILTPLATLALVILLVASLRHHVVADIGRIDADLLDDRERILEEDETYFNECVQSLVEREQPFSRAFPNLLRQRAALLPEARPEAPEEWDIDDLRRLQLNLRSEQIKAARNATARRAAYLLIPIVFIGAGLESWLYLRLSPVKLSPVSRVNPSAAAVSAYSASSTNSSGGAQP